MTYYPTLDEDLARAKEILEKGKPAAESLDGVIDAEGRITEAVITWGGATIAGGDVYAAYKLLESFVAEIEQLRLDQRMLVAFVRNAVIAIGDVPDDWAGTVAEGRELFNANVRRVEARIEDLEAAIKGAETLVSVNMQTITKQQEALTAMTGRNVQLLLEVERLQTENALLEAEAEDALGKHPDP